MRTPIAALYALLFTVSVSALAEEFKATCAYGLSEYGVAVATSCDISWKNPSTNKLYCFSKEEAKQEFLKNPEANIRKAEQKYSELKK